MTDAEPEQSALGSTSPDQAGVVVQTSSAADATDAPFVEPDAPRTPELPNPYGLPEIAVERPEVAVAGAFAGGLVLALILKRLGR